MNTNDIFRRATKEHETLRRLTEPLLLVQKGSAFLQDQLALANESRKIMELADEQRALVGTLASMRINDGAATGLLQQAESHRKLLSSILPEYNPEVQKALAAFHDAMEPARAAFESFERSFRLPEFSEASRLASELAASHEKVMSRARGVAAPLGAIKFDDLFSSNTELEKAMQVMRTPWLSRDNPLLSAHAFGELFALGRAVNTVAPFGADLGEALPRPIFENPVARSQFYYETGLDASLTEFTPEAFDEGMSLAGLPVRLDEDSERNEEDGLSRNECAYRQLLRFERELRHFLERVMAEAFGPDWIKQRTPPGMTDSWKEKRQSAIDKGEEEKPLIEYADFTDYTRIIERNDNWKEVFTLFFHRREDVRESFMRLFPVRICTMHARIITLDDELLLRLEIQRIRRAISRYKPIPGASGESRTRL
jgi:HEPN superfamily Swt1-like protein